MPLLGRHKPAASPTSSPSPPLAGGTSSQAAATTNSNNNNSRQQLCDSPLFGIRRQLPSALDHQAPTNSNSQYSTSAAAAAAAANSGGAGRQQQAAGNKQANIINNNAELMTTSCSIPQQITRQQIHYAFSIMDTNKDGQADVRDLSQMLSNLGIPIDEAILAHIMTNTVSKRGDHRISEAEFLDWISHFIQISDSKPAPAPAFDQKARASQRTALRASRSSTAGSSLAAQPSEVPRARRGSGSGLALMRSLSSSSASPAAGGSQTPPSSSSSSAGKRQSSLANLDNELAGGSQRPTSKGSKAAAATATTAKLVQQSSTDSLEARNDLKAAFCVFDLDGDGFITLDEVRAGLKLLGESWTPAELRRLFSRCSGGGGNSSASAADPAKQRISIDDFVQLLL